jgi:hypothetical protein
MFDTVDALIDAINDYLLDLRKNGGKLEFPMVLDWGGEQSNTDRILRLSSSGKCPRQMAYKAFFPEEQEELSARALNVFIHGDLLHEKERNLIRQVTYLTDVEKHVEFKVRPGLTVGGHIDGKIYIGDKPMILDIKSINTRGFKEAVEGRPRDEYVAQANAYMEAEGVGQAVLWMYNKDTSHRAALILERDEDVIREIRERFISVADATAEALPDKMYEPQLEIRKGKATGREYLPWQCGYCPFVERCWGGDGFDLVFESNRPRWIRDNSEEEPEAKLSKTAQAAADAGEALGALDE